MKIFYRSSLIYNTLYLSLLSAVVLYVNYNIIYEKALLSKEAIKLAWSLTAPYYILCLLTLFALYREKKWSPYLFALLGFSYGFFTFLLLWSNFNKLSLVLLAFFVSLFYYFFTLVKEELNSPYIYPRFMRNYVGGKPEFDIEVIVRTDHQKLMGFLANWDTLGCYIYLDEKIKDCDRKIWLDFPFEGRVFQDRGQIATIAQDKKGIGVYIPSLQAVSAEKKFKWKSFIKILKDRGLTPSRIN